MLARKAPEVRAKERAQEWAATRAGSAGAAAEKRGRLGEAAAFELGGGIHAHHQALVDAPLERAHR